MKRFLLLLVVVLLAVAPCAAAPKREARAVWVTTLLGLDWPSTPATDDASRLAQQRELCALLDRLKAAGINQVLLQTRCRGAGIYPSQIEPWYRSLTGRYDGDPGYDPLAYAITECHRRGMELHAWMVTIPCFDAAEAKRVGKKSLLHTHPTWLRLHEGKYYLDPGLPPVADYLATLAEEITRRYDIDGLHLDYIRYPENAASFPDDATYRKYGRGQTKADWRRANITHIVRTLYNKVKACKPWVKISSSPVGKYSSLSRYPSRGWDAYNVVYQDAQGWLREGIHDALYPMMYFLGDHFYPFAADWAEHAYGRTVCVGLGTYFLSPTEGRWTLADLTAEMHYARALGLGTAHFRCRFFTDNTRGIYDYTRLRLNPYPALPPAMTWQDSLPPTAPQGLRETQTGGGRVRLTWQPSTDNLSGASVRYNVYASAAWPVDTDKAESLVATLLDTCAYTFSQRTRVLEGLHLAVTAIDRCGNESAPAALQEGPESVDLKLTERKLKTVFPLK